MLLEICKINIKVQQNKKKKGNIGLRWLWKLRIKSYSALCMSETKFHILLMNGLKVPLEIN